MHGLAAIRPEWRFCRELAEVILVEFREPTLMPANPSAMPPAGTDRHRQMHGLVCQKTTHVCRFSRACIAGAWPPHVGPIHRTRNNTAMSAVAKIPNRGNVHDGVCRSHLPDLLRSI